MLKGHKHSDETRKKMSEAHKNRPPASEETRKKIGDSNRRRVVSKETIAKIVAKNIGRHASEETKRKMRESHRGKHCGEKNSSWKGGISFEPYCVLFNDEFRERVRNFFNNKCVECGKTEEENGMRLDVHHVLFDKESCCNNNTPLFVALCRSCHAKTNFYREYWEQHFTEIINEKYGGKCYLPKSIATSVESVFSD